MLSNLVQNIPLFLSDSQVLCPENLEEKPNTFLIIYDNVELEKCVSLSSFYKCIEREGIDWSGVASAFCDLIRIIFILKHWRRT